MSKILPVVAEIFYFPYFEVIIHLRSSYIEGHLHLTHLYPLVKSCKLKFQIWVRSRQWLLRYSTCHILRSSSVLGPISYFEIIYYLRLSSIRGHLHLTPFYPLVKSCKLKFQIWVRSDQWLLRYSILIFWGHLPF